MLPSTNCDLELTLTQVINTDFLSIPQVPSFSTEELVLLRHACCVSSRLRCKEQSLLLSSYQFIIGKIENPYCSTCRHSSQNTSHLILHCPATDSLHRSLFCDSLRPVVQAFGSCLASGARWPSAMFPSFGRDQATKQQQNYRRNITSQKELANLDVLKVVNRLRHSLQLAITRFHY